MRGLYAALPSHTAATGAQARNPQLFSIDKAAFHSISLPRCAVGKYLYVYDVGFGVLIWSLEWCVWRVCKTYVIVTQTSC